MLGGLIFVHVRCALSAAALAVLWNAACVLGFGLAVHWSDFATPVPPAVYAPAAVLGAIGAQLSLSAHASLLSTRLPSSAQAELLPAVHAIALAGRAAGWVLFTSLSAGAFASSRALPRTPPNGSLAAQFVLLGLGNLVPCLSFTLMYGRLGDRPDGRPASGSGGARAAPCGGGAGRPAELL